VAKKKVSKKTTASSVTAKKRAAWEDKVAGPDGPGKLISIMGPNMDLAEFTVVGTSEYCQNKFGNKIQIQIREAQEAGDTAKSKKKRSPKDFEKLGREAMHMSTAGWPGIPAAGIRAAMISACRIAGVVMSRAKLAVIVKADGYDDEDGSGLVKITKGKPVFRTLPVRISGSKMDLRCRPHWPIGWEAKIKVEFDRDAITAESVANLLMRVGCQVGLGEGRNDSKNSTGMGWGFFALK